MNALPVLPDPTAIDVATIAALGAELLAWAQSVDDLAAVKDAADRWHAITEYVRRTSREGVAEAEAALRRLEVRIGHLMPPAAETNGRPLPHDVKVIDHHERHDLRLLADHADVVEEVIAVSDDASPPSRRKCLTEIARRRETATLTEIGKITEAAAPRIIAALATLPDIDEADWLVTLRFRATHPDDIRAALPSEAELISMEEIR